MYGSYHRGLLLAPLRRLEKLKEAFIPFWILAGSAQIRLHTATIGYDMDQPNGRGGYERTRSYRTVEIYHSWDRAYHADQVDMQV